tara:strand:+ start:7766 stop:8134 length:369 start_codon:yes stop_codon:yes gene_type:complete
MAYVDGFVLPLKKKNLDAYKRMASVGAKVWIEHGALDYRECVGDDLNIEGVGSFTKGAKLKPDETVVFAWITYRSRAQRDKVNAKVMADPRLAKYAGMAPIIDMKRMMVGGFKSLVARSKPS